MASLPTAYASQRFGRKSLDFYAAAGDVIGADPRARADERRLQDLEGARHTVRLMESGFRLDPGDQASVLRMQPGPARRSRPVAVINHTTAAWTRTHPGAAGLLARAGVARSMNWALTLAFFALAALAAVWPFLRAFLVEIDPAAFSAAPAFDLFALAAGAAPGLADWRLAGLTGPLAAQLSSVAPGLAGFAPHMAFGAIALAGGLLVYALRSWRLIWAPVFIAAAAAGSLGFTGAAGAVTPMLAALAVATSVFLIGGLVNRVRDAARLERRIAVLSDHILRNPPEEMVAGADDQADAEAEAEARPAAETPEPEAEAAADTIAEDAATPAAAAAYRAVERVDSADAEASDAVSDAAADGAGEAEAEVVSEDEAGPVEAQADAEAETAPALEPGGEAEPAAGESEAETQPATFEQEESERLRTDPRYASRAIVLPPPPPMPESVDPAPGAADTQDAASAAGPDTEPDAPAAGGEGARQSKTRTLRPEAPLPANVVPMFAAPAPSRERDEPVE